MEKEPFSNRNNSPKSFLMYGVFHDLSSKNPGFFQPTIKKIRVQNIGNMKRVRSNENSPKPVINQMNFFTTQQLFIGPMKNINKNLDLSRKNEEKEKKNANRINNREILNKKTQRIERNFKENLEKNAKNTIMGFFEKQNKRNFIANKNSSKTSENPSLLPEIQKNQMKNSKNFEEKETKRSNYQFKPYKEKMKSPEFRFLEENRKNSPLNHPQIKTFRFQEQKIQKNVIAKDEKCSSWSIKSSVSFNLHEENLIL